MLQSDLLQARGMRCKNFTRSLFAILGIRPLET